LRGFVPIYTALKFWAQVSFLEGRHFEMGGFIKNWGENYPRYHKIKSSPQIWTNLEVSKPYKLWSQNGKKQENLKF
jgi:hypothetical protein